MEKKEKIFNELEKNGFINFTIKDLEIEDFFNSFIDIKITKLENNNYKTFFSDSKKEKIYTREKIDSLVDCLIHTSEIYFI